MTAEPVSTAGEPRTEAGRALLDMIYDPDCSYSESMVNRAILAIEAEAAQGAAQGAEGLREPYQRGYEAGRRDAERDATLVVAAMVEQAGGEIRLSRKFLVATDGDLTVQDDPATMDRVYRLRSRPSDERVPESEEPR